MTTSIIYPGVTFGGGWTGSSYPGLPDFNVPSAQPTSNNYLSSNYFKLIFPRIPTVAYYCQAVTIPTFSFGTSDQETFLGIPQRRPGSKYYFDTMTISFLLDEEMKAWMEIYNWMESMANLTDTLPIEKGGKVDNHLNWMSDARIFVTNSSYTPTLQFIFRDVFPTKLYGWDFNSTRTDNIPIMGSATFTYTSYVVRPITADTRY